MNERMILRILISLAYDDFFSMLSAVKDVLRSNVLRNVYKSVMYEKAWIFKEEDMFNIFEDELLSYMKYGGISALMEIPGLEIAVGACVPEKHDLKAVRLKLEGGKYIYPDFQLIESEEEAERIVRNVLLMKRGVELTRLKNNYIDKELYAVRPSEKEWGLVWCKKTE